MIVGWTNQQNKLGRCLFAEMLCKRIYVSLSHKYLSSVKLYSMLFYNRISESECIDANRTGLDISRECNICQFYFFKGRNFLYQPHVCNGCQDASLHAISLIDLKIILVKGNTYRIVCNLLYNESSLSSSLNDKLGSL